MSGAKRAPSSSVKKATAIGRSVTMPCCSSVSTTSRPASTPRLPSKRPPVRTVSMCEPVITGAARGIGSRPGGDDVADRVDRHVEPEVAHPRHDEVAALAVVVGQRQPGAAPLAVRPVDRADLAERLDPCRQAVAVDAQVVAVHGRSVMPARRESNAAISASASQNASTAAVEQLLAALGGGGRRVADVAVGTEVVRQPAEADPAAEAHVAVRRPAARARCGWRRDMSTRSGARCSISDVSSVPPWTPMPSSSAGDVPALVGRHAGMGEERHQPVLQAQLAVGHAEQRRVAAVAVEEHELAGRRHRHAAADVVEHGEQRRRRQPDRAGRPGVLVRLGVGERRQQPHVELVADPLDRGLGDALGDQQVGVERQVRAVLLDRPERLDDDAAGRRGRGRCRGPGVRRVDVMGDDTPHARPWALTARDCDGWTRAGHDGDPNSPRPDPDRRRLRRDRRSAPATTGWSPPPISPAPGCARSCSRPAPTSAAPPPASRSPAPP